MKSPETETQKPKDTYPSSKFDKVATTVSRLIMAGAVLAVPTAAVGGVGYAGVNIVKGMQAAEQAEKNKVESLRGRLLSQDHRLPISSDSASIDMRPIENMQVSSEEIKLTLKHDDRGAMKPYTRENTLYTTKLPDDLHERRSGGGVGFYPGTGKMPIITYPKGGSVKEVEPVREFLVKQDVEPEEANKYEIFAALDKEVPATTAGAYYDAEHENLYVRIHMPTEHENVTIVFTAAKKAE